MFKYIKNTWILLYCAAIMLKQSLAILYVSYFKKQNQRQAINRITHQGAVKLLDIAKVKYTIENLSSYVLHPNEAYILMANHQSLFDVPLIYATLTGTIRPLTKAELFKIPIFGQAMRAGECVPINRKDPLKRREFVTQAKQIMQAGVSLLVFPEGTRSLTGELLEFKSGGFYLAKEMTANIIPIAISNTRSIMYPKRLFISLHKEVSIRIGQPIKATAENTIDNLKEKVRQSITHLLT